MIGLTIWEIKMNYNICYCKVDKNIFSIKRNKCIPWTLEKLSIVNGSLQKFITAYTALGEYCSLSLTGSSSSFRHSLIRNISVRLKIHEKHSHGYTCTLCIYSLREMCQDLHDQWWREKFSELYASSNKSFWWSDLTLKRIFDFSCRK